MEKKKGIQVVIEITATVADEKAFAALEKAIRDAIDQQRGENGVLRVIVEPFQKGEY